jgi:hypothetical protein
VGSRANIDAESHAATNEQQWRRSGDDHCIMLDVDNRGSVCCGQSFFIALIH